MAVETIKDVKTTPSKPTAPKKPRAPRKPNPATTKPTPVAEVKTYVDIPDVEFGYFTPDFKWLTKLLIRPSASVGLPQATVELSGVTKAIKTRTVFGRLDVVDCFTDKPHWGVSRILGERDSPMSPTTRFFKDEPISLINIANKELRQVDLGDILKLEENELTIVGAEETEAELVIYLLSLKAQNLSPDCYSDLDEIALRFKQQIDVPERIRKAYGKLFCADWTGGPGGKPQTYFNLVVGQNPTFLEWYGRISDWSMSRRALVARLIRSADEVFHYTTIDDGAMKLLLNVIGIYSTVPLFKVSKLGEVEFFNNEKVTPEDLKRICPEIFEVACRVVESTTRIVSRNL